MFFRINSSTAIGTHGQKIVVETTVSNALPNVKIVGLPEKAVDEAKERVLPAIKNSGFNLIPKHITINLAPSYIPKKGASLDLPIALSILGSYKILNDFFYDDCLFVGELSLDGKIRRTNGILQTLDVMEKEHFSKTIIPEENIKYLPIIKEYSGEIFVASSLKQIVEFLLGKNNLIKIQSTTRIQPKNKLSLFRNIRGNSIIKRIALISAVGNHHFLMCGPPGAGKTMTAKAIQELIPTLSSNKIYETALVYEASKSNVPESLINGVPPFRSPHHTASYASIIGGGTNPTPGEISLAHNGVLFLDELPEFNKITLNALREPIEEREVSITRSNYKITFPCNFTLIASMNPCACGYFGSSEKQCTCSSYQVQKYSSRVSRILIDRIDLYAYVSKPKIKDLTDNKNDNTDYLRIINNALCFEMERFNNPESRNSEIKINDIKEKCNMSLKAQKLIQQAYDKLPLTARSYLKTIRVARTIADIDQSPPIKESHIAEALSYRYIE
ncbi:MAG TPA: YifB family Mg chelatase-like AAA ATPase [Candidatus Dojkabacteria bacterium]|nr:YifB family Mg chelatase-like AAA ATPase [Candidatus Dojkabacteria bacterium]HQF36617.1 YifB family Mg chelatase-like AAA ATPase [Candidatus Dojkabacteria bacterium]